MMCGKGSGMVGFRVFLVVCEHLVSPAAPLTMHKWHLVWRKC